jgi:hypothetical protein
VTDHARSLTHKLWAEFFGVSLKAFQKWRTKGVMLERWSGPSWTTWDNLKAEAVKNLQANLAKLMAPPLL